MKFKLSFSKISLKQIGLGFLFLSVLFQSCKDFETDFEKQQKRDEDRIKNYLTTNNISAIKSPEGLYYSAIEEHPEEQSPKVGEILNISCKLSTLEGVIVDSAKTPVRMKFGGYTVPSGINYAISYMKKNEKYLFFFPSNYAYGNVAAEGLFTANAVIMAEIQLLGIYNDSIEKIVEDTIISSYLNKKGIVGAQKQPSGLYYEKITAGADPKPLPGNRVVTKLKGTLLNGTEFFATAADGTFSYNVGANQVIKGLDEGTRLMQKGEKARFYIPSHIAYGEGQKGHILVLPYKLSSEKIPPYSILVFEVELIAIN